MGKKIVKKVLFIGWDAADWKVINPLVDAGKMPALEKLINNGVIGNMATLDPPLSPMLWTSIATGKTADKHGILGFVEPDPNTQVIRPVYSSSRKVKAIWNILTNQGYKTHVIGWWPSHPAEPINGIAVSNLFHKPNKHDEKEWGFPKGAVHPPELEQIMANLRVHPKELTGAHLQPFVPKLTQLVEDIEKEIAKKQNEIKEEGEKKGNKGNKKEHMLNMLAKNIAECASIQAMGTWAIENKDWDFAAVYFDGIDHFCHGFMKYHPPRRDFVDENLYEYFKEVVNGAYIFHDMLLERMLQLAGDDVTVVLMSDHGFHSDHLRLRKIPKDPAGPAYEHNPFGVICISGYGIQKDERIYGANLLDVTPTLLTMFGLPVGKDMDGKALTQAFEEPIVPEYIDSWENLEGDFGTHPADLKEDPWAAQEAMNQLIELGYIEKPDENKEKALEKTINESQFYLSRALIHAKKYSQALEILEKLYAKDKVATRYALKLITCYQILRKYDEAKVVINELRQNKNLNLPRLDYLEGVVLMSERQHRKALFLFQKASESMKGSAQLHVDLGNTYTRMGRYSDAEKEFKNALEIDVNNAIAYLGLATTSLKKNKNEDAAEFALNSIGLMYHSPISHYRLGESLMRIGEYEQAEQAFKVCLSQNYNMKKAHLWLIKLYEENLKQPEKAEPHKKFMDEIIKETITIVSGLPRSGTSMMMQALKNGGLNILTDNIRKDDNNNPKGYLEYEKVKKLHTDNTWVDEASGKCIKIVAPLLTSLPLKYNYRIIFMERDLNEILISQQKMLGKPADSYPTALAEAFTKQVEKAKAWIKSQPNVSAIFVNYSDIVANPMEEMQNVADFLDEDLEIEKMASAVDKNLYRNKNEKNLAN